ADSISAALLMSAGTAIARPPSASISFANPASLSPPRATSATAYSFANRRASALPSPAPTPTTTATFFVLAISAPIFFRHAERSEEKIVQPPSQKWCHSEVLFRGIPWVGEPL